MGHQIDLPVIYLKSARLNSNYTVSGKRLFVSDRLENLSDNLLSTFVVPQISVVIRPNVLMNILYRYNDLFCSPSFRLHLIPSLLDTITYSSGPV